MLDGHLCDQCACHWTTSCEAVKFYNDLLDELKKAGLLEVCEPRGCTERSRSGLISLRIMFVVVCINFLYSLFLVSGLDILE